MNKKFIISLFYVLFGLILIGISIKELNGILIIGLILFFVGGAFFGSSITDE